MGKSTRRQEQSNENAMPTLRKDEKGLALVSGDQEIRGDFTRMLPRLKQANLERELIVKAARMKADVIGERRPYVVDATAGLGEDAILLAAAGFQVRMYERDAVIAALLRDALERAKNVPELAPIVAHMELMEGDSMTALRQMEQAPDVVLLDPMFPARQKSGLIKKKFQLLQQLETPCEEEEALLAAAMAAAPFKIVIKRPAKGPYLAGKKPSYSLDGKAIRYDCIVLPRK